MVLNGVCPSWGQRLLGRTVQCQSRGAELIVLTLHT